MEDSKQLANRFRDVLLDGKWIANTNFNEQISDMTMQQATKKIGSLNTIALLTFHINYYLAGVNNVFEGGKLEIKDKYSFDFDPIETEEEWENLRNTMLNNAEKFAFHIESMSIDKLNAGFVEERYGTYRRNIEGTIEHCYYHLGQIVLIKKMVLEMELEGK